MEPSVEIVNFVAGIFVLWIVILVLFYATAWVVKKALEFFIKE